MRAVLNGIAHAKDRRVGTNDPKREIGPIRLERGYR